MPKALRGVSNTDKTIEPNLCKGQKLVFVKDTSVHALTQWHAPATFGHAVTVPRDTKAIVNNDSIPTAEAFSCIPEDYDAFGKAFVPEHLEQPDKYSGYYLVVLKSCIGDSVEYAT